MKDNHVFSESYERRKQAVLEALFRESALPTRASVGMPIKIAAVLALISALTVSVYAAAQWIDFYMEKDGTDVRVHAAISETVTAESEPPKPLRSWRTEEGEIGIRLVIPDLPDDMEADKTANGKYHGRDASRAMTVNGIDLRRSDLDHLIGGASGTKQFTAGGKAVYVIEQGETAFYNRIAYIVFEKEELVLMLWISHGITDDELFTMAETITLAETADTALAIPIQNEPRGDADIDIPFVYTDEDDPVYEADLLKIGESVRDRQDWYTVTVDSVRVHDNIRVLNPSCLLREDFICRFTDGDSNLIPYIRTPIVQGEDGTSRFGESVSVTKKLYVVTLTMADVTMDDINKADRERMLTACVNSFELTAYTVESGKISRISENAVVDRKPNEHADTSETVYREYIGNGQWRLAYLIDTDIAEGNLVLSNNVGEIFVKVQ